MARRPERWTDRWATAIVLAIGTAVLAGWCVAKADGDLGELTGRFSVLFGLFGLMVLLTLLEKRSRDRAYKDAWQRACHILVGEHSHDGIVLTGTWKGRPFRAVANAYMPGPSTGMVLAYIVTMPSEHAGPAWKAQRPTTQLRGAHLWTVKTDAPTEKALADAGLLDAIEEAERRAVHLRRDIRLSFRPKTADVAYEDGSGEPSCAADLIVHLDLVRRAVDVHAAAMTSADARHDSS